MATARGMARRHPSRRRCSQALTNRETAAAARDAHVRDSDPGSRRILVSSSGTHVSVVAALLRILLIYFVDCSLQSPDVS
jgi:hypothetical protein